MHGRYARNNRPFNENVELQELRPDSKQISMLITTARLTQFKENKTSVLKSF